MTQPFKLVRGDARLVTRFSKPLIEAFAKQVGVYEDVFGSLAPYGVRLTDIQWDAGDGSVGGANYNCWLFNFTTTMRLYLEGFDLNCLRLTDVNGQEVVAAAVSCLEALERLGAGFKSHDINVGLHGFVAGTTPRDFLRNFVSWSPPDELGPTTAAATTYQFGERDAQVRGALTLDVSAVVSDALFIGNFTVLKAAAIPVPALLPTAATLLKRRLDGVGLSLEWPR